MKFKLPWKQKKIEIEVPYPTYTDLINEEKGMTPRSKPISTEPKPLTFLPTDYYYCPRCNELPTTGTHYWKNPNTFYEIHVYNLECPNGHKYTEQTDGG